MCYHCSSSSRNTGEPIQPDAFAVLCRHILTAMSELVGLLSTGMLIYNEGLTGERPSNFCKRAAIMCDHIFIDPQGLGPPGKRQDQWIYNVLGEQESAFLEGSRTFRQLILRPQDIGDSREVMAALWNMEQSYGPNPDNIHPKALETVESLDHNQRAILGDDYKRKGELALMLTHDIRLPIICQQWFDTSVAILNPLHRQLVSRLLPLSSETDTQTIMRELEAASIADFGQLSWAQILHLRRSRFWHDFRVQLEVIGRQGDSLPTAIWDELWRYTGETFPKLGKAGILGIIGSLPFPGSPIIGLASSAADLAHAMKAREEFGWLYFLFEAKKASR
jgi:hypothetical protein